MDTKIDFNCDMGESYGVWKMGLDEEVIKHVTSSNVACGYHAGDPMWMQHTVNLGQGQRCRNWRPPELPGPSRLRTPQHERHSRRGPSLC